MPKRLNCLGVKRVEKGRGHRGSKSSKRRLASKQAADAKKRGSDVKY